jgi:putative ATPase
LYIARRMLRFASEDIGNINPNALLLANQVFETVKNLGAPECYTALVQLAEYLGNSPKSNTSYTSLQMAQDDVRKYGSLAVPVNLRNASTKLLKEIGYGRGYEYDHELPNKKSTQQCMPDALVNRNYFKKLHPQNLVPASSKPR